MGRVLPVLCFTILASGVLFWRSDAYAQDETITNAEQLAAVIDQSGLWYPLVSPAEQPLSSQALGVFWADFNQLTNAIGDVRNFEAETQYGTSVWRLRLTRTADETVFSYAPSETNLFQVAMAEGNFSSHYERVLWSWCILGAFRNSESYDDLLADGYTFLEPKRLVLDFWVGDINDCPTYNDNVAAVNSAALGLSAGGFMMMDDEDPPSGGGDPCSITNLTQPFYVTSITNGTSGITLVWQSCPMYRYVVLSASALSTNTAWAAQGYTSYVWGQPAASATSWTDLSTTNASIVTQRFYRVQRLLGSLIAAGGYHSAAVRPDGTVWAWGGNDHGQLGDSTRTNQWSPEEISSNGCFEGVNNVQALAGGYDYTVAADSTGVVWSWGDNGLGQLGNGGGAGDFSAPSPISGISNVVSMAAGSNHTLALRADGTVWAWGNDAFSDERGSGKLGVGNFTPGSTNSPVQSLVQTQIVAVAAGADFSAALDKNGRVWTWGENNAGVLGNGGAANTNLPILLTTISNVVAIAAGNQHMVALTTNKNVWTWGSDNLGQLGRSANQFGPNPSPVQVSGLSNVVAIAAGYEFTLAVTSNGHVYAWGDNSFGQLGTNATDVVSTNLPMLVAGISNAVLVAAHSSGNHSVAITVVQGTNQYWAWGESDSGQVGNGTNATAVDAPTGPLPFVHFNTCAACIQLGTNGTFTASASGTLFLYFNDDKAQFNDNSGSYTASVTGLGSVPVMANNWSGVAIGTVTNGGLYTYTASGLCTNCSSGGCGENASGVNPDTGILRTCGDTSNFICPGFQCYSLVGKIE